MPGQMLTQPREQRAQMFVSLILIFLTMVGRLVRERLRASVAAHDISEIVIKAFELKDNLIRFPGHSSTWLAKWGQDIDIEITRRLSGAPLVRGTKEQIAWPGHFVRIPWQLIRPDQEAGNVRCHWQVQKPTQRIIEEAIEVVLLHEVPTLGDPRIKIDRLFQIKKVLPIIRVMRDVLPADGTDDLLQRHLNCVGQ